MKGKNFMLKENFKLLAEEWFEKGSHDLDTAKRELKYKGWTDIICFHCHQAAEKYLKGYLTFRGLNIGKLKKHQIHELLKLCQECQRFDADFKKSEDDCIDLNPYYIEPRYPLGRPIAYSYEEAARAIKMTERVVNFVLKKVRIKKKRARTQII